MSPVIQPNMAQMTDKELNSYLANHTKSFVAADQLRNDFHIYLTTTVAPIVISVGILLATIYLSMNCTHIGLTNTVTLGTYSIICIAAVASSITYLITKGVMQIHKHKEQSEGECKIDLINRLLLSKEHNLEDKKFVTVEQIKQKKEAIQTELKEMFDLKEKHWQKGKENMKTILTTVVLGLLTCLATIFASEYMPMSGLTVTAAGGVIAGVFLTGLAATIFYPFIACKEDNSKKCDMEYFIKPVALLIAAIVGTIFLSEYLPQDHLSSTFYFGTCTVVGIGAFATVAGLITLVSQRLASEYNCYCIPDLRRKHQQREEVDKIKELYKRLQLKDIENVSVYS